MFFGEYNCRCSDGRVDIPFRFMDDLNGSVAVKEERGGVLSVYPRKEPGTKVLAICTQHRFTIPKAMRIHIKIKDDVMLIGCNDHFEVWNPAKWREKRKKTQKDFRALMAKAKG